MPINAEVEPMEIDAEEVVVEAGQDKKYELVSWKTVKDKTGADVQIEDKKETVTILELDLQISALRTQVTSLEAQIAAIEAKKTLIAGIA